MLCDNCKKKEATVHIKQVHNGQCETSNLCSICAGELEKSGVLGVGFNLADVLMNLENFAGHPAPGADADSIPEPAADMGCPLCGWTLEKLRSSGGKLGCPECYEVFAPLVNEVIAHVQRGRLHVGKRPGAASGSRLELEAELHKFQAEIQEAISAENYERAAVCRDRIVEVRNKLRELESPRI